MESYNKVFACLFLAGCFHLTKDGIWDQRRKMTFLWLYGRGKAVCPHPFVPQLSGSPHPVAGIMIIVSWSLFLLGRFEQTYLSVGHFLLCKSSSGHCGYGNWKSENKACGSGQYIFLRYLLCAKLRTNRCMLDWVLAIKGHSIKKIGRWKMVFGHWHKYCDSGEGHQAQARVEEARGLEGS